MRTLRLGAGRPEATTARGLAGGLCTSAPCGVCATNVISGIANHAQYVELVRAVSQFSVAVDSLNGSVVLLWRYYIIAYTPGLSGAVSSASLLIRRMSKNMHKPLPALLISILSPFPSSQAEDLLGIYDLAVKSDPTLREAEQNLYATREVKPQARALLLPNFGVTADADYQNVKSSGNSSLGGFNRNHTYQCPAPPRRPSPSTSCRPGSASAKPTTPSPRRRRSTATLRSNSWFALRRPTSRCHRFADAVRVQEALVAADERQLEQSRQRFEVGLVAITDVNDSLAAYDRSRANLITAENDLNNAWEALRRSRSGSRCRWRASATGCRWRRRSQTISTSGRKRHWPTTSASSPRSKPPRPRVRTSRFSDPVTTRRWTCRPGTISVAPVPSSTPIPTRPSSG